MTEEQMIEKACTAYCKCCDTHECFDIDECDWVIKFRKQLKRELKKKQ